MNKISQIKLPALLCLLILPFLIAPGASYAVPYDFNSGSTGANGPFPPVTIPLGATDITLDLNNGQVTFLPNNTTSTLPNTPAGGFADGVFNFSTVNIPDGITLTFVRHAFNPPITFLTTGDIKITGTIDISGENGEDFKPVDSVDNAKGGNGGPGGFKGGNSGISLLANTSGTAGQGPGGGRPGDGGNRSGGGQYAVSTDFISLIPILGGSGGGGGYSDSFFSATGGSEGTGSGGGGGGGAILLASSTTITIDGIVIADGGRGGACNLTHGNGRGVGGGGGAAGAIRLVAETIAGKGSLIVNGGQVSDNQRCSRPGGAGRIRLEAFNFIYTGTPSQFPSVSTILGPVSNNSNPPLPVLGELRISAVGGIAAVAPVFGSHDTPDISLPNGMVNPVDIELTSTNIPVGTAFRVRVTPIRGLYTEYTSTPSVATANPNETTASAQVNLPIGEVAVLSARAEFRIQTASLYPLIDGEKVERVMIASNLGGKSNVTFVTESGRLVREQEMRFRMLTAQSAGNQ